ncbi:alpha/beta hydrolase [Colwellia sp. E2M01]|nr:alpha/beta hydrolase [Colwellia sp. E2M01]
MIKYILQLCFFTLAITSIPACSLLEIGKQSTQLERLPSVSGTIELNNDNKPIYVMLLKQSSIELEVINQVMVNDKGEYNFNVLPDNYTIMAYVDDNKNAKKETNERFSFYGGEEENGGRNIPVKSGEHIKLEIFAVNDELIDLGESQISDHSYEYQRNIGKVISLDSPIFAVENAKLGLWKPITFLSTIGGGLFMLQDFEVGKTPIIFVHGILGNPTEFSKMIESVDREKYQPWVYYYPTGVQLDLISDYLLTSLNQLQNEYGFTNINLITHSMGGLMSRSFLMQHEQENSNFDVSFYMTINSPLYGMKSARAGVNSSPIIIPSWRDLATGSDFIKKVHNWHVPQEVNYHLVFSYLEGEEGDGVVPMNSQLSLSLQQEADNIYGFPSQHAEILHNEAFIKLFNKLLIADSTSLIK